MTHLLAIDPGLDGLGFCVLERVPDRDRRTADELIRWIGTSVSDPSCAMLERLNDLWAPIEAELGTVSYAIIELPDMSGSYRRHRGGGMRDSNAVLAGTLQPMFLVAGYVLGRLEERGIACHIIPPIKMQKEAKLLLAKQIALRAQARDPKVTKRKTIPSKDALDAVALAAAHFTRFPLP